MLLDSGNTFIFWAFSTAQFFMSLPSLPFMLLSSLLVDQLLIMYLLLAGLLALSLYRKPFIWLWRASNRFSGVSIERQELKESFFGTKGWLNSFVSVFWVPVLGKLMFDFDWLFSWNGLALDPSFSFLLFLKCSTSTQGNLEFFGDNLMLLTISTEQQP